MPHSFQFTLSHYLFIVIVCLFSFIIGGRLTVRFRFHSFCERLYFSTSLGFGLLALLIYFLGLVKGLYGRILVPVVLAAVIVSFFTWPGLLRNIIDVKSWGVIFRKPKWATYVWLILITIVVLYTYRLSLYPPNASDSISYHLAATQIYTRAHALVFTPYLRYPIAPQLNEMLFVGAFVAYDDISTQVLTYSMLLLVACGVYAFSRRYFSPWVGILASALWMGSPLLILFGTVAFIDVGLTLFSFAGVYSFINYYKTNEIKWLWLSGIFLGFAASVKYLALFYVLVCGLISLWIAFIKRKYTIPVYLGIAIIVIAAPFYLRDYYYSGNPFFPFLSNIFPQRLWNAADVASQLQEQYSYGLPKTLLSFVTLPWYLIYKPNIFQTALAERLVFSPIYFLAFVSIPLMFFIRKTRLMNIFSASYTIFWFFTPQISRYLFPVIPFLAITASIAFDYLVGNGQKILSYWNISNSYTRVIGPAFISIIAFITLIPSLRYGQQVSNYYGLVPLTSADRSEFYTKYMPTYPAYRFLNQSLGENYSLFALGDATMAYFAKGTFMGDWFGPARYSLVLDKLGNDVLLYQQLHQLGANYFLINKKLQAQIPEALIISPYFTIVDQSNNYIVFKLADTQ